MRVQVENGLVKSCYSSTENAIDTSKNEACTALGGILKDNKTCELVQYPQAPSRSLAVSTDYISNYVKKDGDMMTGDLIGTKFCVGDNCRDFTEKTCAPGQLVEKINGDGSLVCKGISCPENKYFEGFNASGGIICNKLPTGSCDSNQYIVKINSDGSVVCKDVPYHWGVVCSPGTYIEQISSSGVPTCKTITSLLSNMNCPAGSFVASHSNGVLGCRAADDAGAGLLTPQILIASRVL